MKIHKDPAIRFTALLAVVLVALPSASAGGTEFDGDAREMRHNGVLREHADLALFRVADLDTFQAPELRLDATSLYGYHLESDYLTTNLVRTPIPRDPTDVGTQQDPLRDAVLRALGTLPSFDIRIIPTNATLQSSVRGITGLEVLPKAEMHRSEGIAPQQDGRDNSPTGPENMQFVYIKIDQPTLVSQSEGGTLDVVVSGDFILEIYGVDVALEATGEPERFYPTGSRQSMGAQESPVRMEREQRLRLFVEDGEMSIRHADDDRIAQWATYSARLHGDEGIVAFHDLAGEWDLVNAARLGEDRFRFTGGYTGLLAPREDGRMDVRLTESAGPPAPMASLWLPPEGFNPVPVAAALLAAALAVVLVRRLRQAPPLAHMESALEAGAFSRAARLADRILRTDPSKESAHLGRAIALSRSGRPERVVRDLKPFLEHNDPSDGTLHYVLGLAYRDLGKESAATEALSEAVRRTPALAQQVPDAAPEPRRRVCEGDAQGYT